MEFVLLSAAEIQIELCNRIKKQRLTKNITQSTFAARVGVSTQTIKNLENDRRCTLDTFIRCLIALGLVAELEPVMTTEIVSIAQLEASIKPLRRRATAKGKKS